MVGLPMKRSTDTAARPSLSQAGRRRWAEGGVDQFVAGKVADLGEGILLFNVHVDPDALVADLKRPAEV